MNAFSEMDRVRREFKNRPNRQGKSPLLEKIKNLIIKKPVAKQSKSIVDPGSKSMERNSLPPDLQKG